MKNRLITNSIRTIKKSFSRFLPLMVMSFLGVFVFAGLKSTKPDMIDTLDKFLDEYNVYDFKIMSTLGLTNNDLTYLKSIPNVKNIEYSYSKDVLIKDENDDYVINISNLPKDINIVKLIKGKLPEKDNEIVVEENLVNKTNYKIGSIIKINDSDFKYQEYTIVGLVQSGLYFNNDRLNQDRGSTKIGNGTINYYSYILDTSFNLDYYNSIYLTLNNTKELITGSKEYEDTIKKEDEYLNNIKEEQEKRRYEEVYNEAKDKIQEEESKANNELKKAKKELDNAKSALNNSKIILDNSKIELDNYKVSLDNAKEQLDENSNKLNELINTYNIDINNINNNINDLENEINRLESIINNLDKNLVEYQIYVDNLNKLKETLLLFNNIKLMNDEINKNKELYENNLSLYNDNYLKYENGLKEYNDGLSTYNSNLNKYNKEKSNIDKEINKAKDELNNLKEPTWYIYSRKDADTYPDYIDDVTSVDNLAKIFPIVFFGVAILVSLISMNRMVEEERGEIGTFKSLGFNNQEILFKYVLFSSVATFVGGLIGYFFGAIIIPLIISNIYGMLFHLPKLTIKFDLTIILLSLGISLICILGTTIYTTYKVLKEKPAELMRAKSPKNGKKILLENLKLIWNHLSFSKKITLRNMLRYKKRGLVTIVGIAGCSALLLCGFGIRDAIIDIANKQYQDTFKYDVSIYVNNNIDIINDNIISRVDVQNINVKSNNVKANLFVVDKNEIDNIINLIDESDNKIKLTSDKVIITDKLAKLNNYQVGDTINLIDDENKTYSYQIGGIVKNYLMHYIYIDKDLFNKDNEYNTNIVYLNLKDNINKNNLTKELMDNSEVLKIMYIEDFIKSADNMLKSLNKVVIIILVLSASLSFVVLYNLSNININERKREISTLKVLGFYDKEVDNYITKENIIYTIIGIIIGLVLGYFLTKIVIMTVEIEKAHFIYNIKLISYILTIVITIFFTFLVNLVTHFNLKRIDMIASLKSVE